ncbi:MAG: hypothetical protein IKW39_02285 [Alphaproteobacteria bacterium]|nr:hypothetical protein [Alphaproteobacteria bacterium]
MKKSLFFTIIIYTLFFATPAFACDINPTTTLFFFVATPVIIGIIIYFINKRKKQKLSPHILINQIFQTSVTTLAIMGILKIFIANAPEFSIPIIILSLLSIFADSSKSSPKKQEDSKLKTNLSYITLLSIICAQIIILLLYSVVLGSTPCSRMN